MPASPPPPSTATHCLLALLALRSWTGYELTAQARRSLHHLWPTSEAHLYREQKRLVTLGWAAATKEKVGRRTRTRYTITPAGRSALRRWMATDPAPPSFEIEGLVRTFFGDHGSVDDLARSLRTTAAQARDMRDELAGYVDEYLDTGGPFPDRLHVVALAVEAYGELLAALEAFCTATATEVGGWATTADRPPDDDTRRRLHALRRRLARDPPAT